MKKLSGMIIFGRSAFQIARISRAENKKLLQIEAYLYSIFKVSGLQASIWDNFCFLRRAILRRLTYEFHSKYVALWILYYYCYCI